MASHAKRTLLPGPGDLNQAHVEAFSANQGLIGVAGEEGWAVSHLIFRATKICAMAARLAAGIATQKSDY